MDQKVERKAPVENGNGIFPSSGRPNILIVDDRRENLVATEKVLKHLNASIFKAMSGNEALSLMLRHRFAVVLLDVQMPEMDGFETAKLMQEHESMSGVPIIFVTAINKEEKYATQAAEIGAVDYIFKPINPDILCSKVKVYLDLYLQREQILHLNAGLQQAQKMEAIGNLTGGMAHDFNNLLSIIIGNLDSLSEQLEENSPPYQLSQAALEAALRGADLTRRLLAFARQQALQPQHININKLVEGITKLLARTLGEDIPISLNLAPDTWTVVADPAQLESALTNLATNARDAMPHGGQLSIATHNGHLDADYAAQHAEVTPGDYVVIEVTDTGTGIRPEVAARIFEPFFTTKERGKGTGLGLAMIFGFMKQSGGHVNVYSEIDIGTTFRLYLPRAVKGTETIVQTVQPAKATGGHETILVVEDNGDLRNIVKQQLNQLGYHVLEAANGAEALKLLTEGDKIDLLFSDIVMPGKINGMELARLATERWPSLKVILTSGFPDTQVNGQQESPAGLRLLSKPYRKADLARTLREVFEGVNSKG